MKGLPAGQGMSRRTRPMGHHPEMNGRSRPRRVRFATGGGSGRFRAALIAGPQLADASPASLPKPLSLRKNHFSTRDMLHASAKSVNGGARRARAPVPARPWALLRPSHFALAARSLTADDCRTHHQAPNAKQPRAEAANIQCLHLWQHG